MATRMQQRRGTAEQWTLADPVLAAGEIGLETDTNKFKIGDGVNTWDNLAYFVNSDGLSGELEGYATEGYVDSAISDVLGGAPELLDTLNELAAAIGDDANFLTTISGSIADAEAAAIAAAALDATDKADAAEAAAIAHADSLAANYEVAGAASAAVTTANLYTDGEITSALGIAQGYADTAETDAKNYADSLAENYDIAGAAATAVSNHSSETTNVHGIADTSTLALTTDVDDALALKAPLESPTFTGTVSGVTKAHVGLGNVDNTSDANKPVSTATQTALDAKAPLESPTFTGTVSGVTKAHVGLGNVDNTSDANKPVSTATQTALDAKASLSGANFIGNVEVDGNLIVDGDFTVNGTNFSASATSIVIEDNMVQLAHNQTGNTVDLGIVVGYNDGTAQHAGIVRDVSENTWKLFKGVETEPSTTVAFGEGSLDDLALSNLNAASATIGDVSNTELQYLNGVTSGIQDQLDAKAPLESPTFTGTVSGVTKAHVGLGNVDNTSDVNKPVSTAMQNALDLKASLANPTFSGSVTLPQTTSIGNISATELGYLDGVTSNIQTQLNSKASTADALPSQSGNSGKYLTTDGTSASWSTVSGGTANDDTIFKAALFFGGN